MDELLKKIIEILPCESQWIPPQKDGEGVINLYKEAKADGIKNGYTPVILVPDENLLEMLENAKEPEYYLNEYKKHDGKQILDGYLGEIKKALEAQNEPWEEVVNTVERGQELDQFAGFVSEEWGETLDVLLVKVPTENPWEVFAWIPMGGWNECPPSEYIISIMKHWYEEYKFETMIITSDMIEGMVPQKITEEERAVAAGIEHYAFCPDLIEQCCGDATIGQWADTLMKSYIWFFWWD